MTCSLFLLKAVVILTFSNGRTSFQVCRSALNDECAYALVLRPWRSVSFIGLSVAGQVSLVMLADANPEEELDPLIDYIQVCVYVCSCTLPVD